MGECLVESMYSETDDNDLISRIGNWDGVFTLDVRSVEVVQEKNFISALGAGI